MLKNIRFKKSSVVIVVVFFSFFSLLLIKEWRAVIDSSITEYKPFLNYSMMHGGGVTYNIGALMGKTTIASIKDINKSIKDNLVQGFIDGVHQKFKLSEEQIEIKMLHVESLRENNNDAEVLDIDDLTFYALGASKGGCLLSELKEQGKTGDDFSIKQLIGGFEDAVNQVPQLPIAQMQQIILNHDIWLNKVGRRKKVI